MPSKVDPPPPGKSYPPEVRQRAVALAAEIGTYRAAKELGIGPNAIRRWIDPAFGDRERTLKRLREHVPCIRCGQPTNIYKRKHRHLGALCHPCVQASLATERRGWSTDELVDLYLNQLMSTNEIASLTGMSQTAVDGALRRAGTPMRSSREAVQLRPGGRPEHGKVNPEEIRSLWEAGMSTTKIAAELACAGGTVLYHLRRMGLVPPAKAKADRPSPSRAGTSFGSVSA